MNRVLIVVDAQEDFVRGTLRNEEAIKALPILHNVVKYADKNKVFIYYTMDSHYDNYENTQEGKRLPVKHCIKYTDGWDICEEAMNKTSHGIVCKETFGSLTWESKINIREADEIWLCGFCTDICVSANFQILKASAPEARIVVIEDACAGVTPELHKAALMVMKSCQADVMTFDELKKENK